MGITIEGGEAWGSRLEYSNPTVLHVNQVSSPAPDTIHVSLIEAPSLADIKNKALTDLKAITEGIEADIAYFNTLGGLAIAMNKLGILKVNLKNVMTGLERI